MFCGLFEKNHAKLLVIWSFEAFMDFFFQNQPNLWGIFGVNPNTLELELYNMYMNYGIFWLIDLYFNLLSNLIFTYHIYIDNSALRLNFYLNNNYVIKN